MVYLIFVLGLVASVPLRFVKQSELNKEGGDTIMDNSSGFLTATFHVGTPEVEVNMFLSQSHSQFSIPFADKEGSSRYNMSASSTLTNTKEGTFSNLKGYTGQDVVSFDGLTVNDQEIFIANYTGVYTDDFGDIGLGLDDDLKEKTFIYRLHETKVISDAVFSINIHDMEFKVGDYNAGIYEDNDYHSLDADDGWTFTLSKVDFYGNLGGFSSSVKFDFTQELIWCNSGELTLFETYINLFYGYKKKNGRYYVSCTEEDIDDFLRLDFVIQKEKIYIYPRSYINYSNGICEFLISSTASDTWIFGKPLFNEYLAFFDVGGDDVYLYRFNETSFFSSYKFYVLLAFIVLLIIVIIAAILIKRKKDVNDYGAMKN